MYRDRSLIPSEAIRLLALGLLAERPYTYAELAAATRHFVSHLTGPSLELMGPSIELLRQEGLIDADGPASENPSLTLNEAGLLAMGELLEARVRQPLDDVGKLVIALKMRFVDRLPDDRRARQIDQLRDLIAAEQNRFRALADELPAGQSLFGAWLTHEIDLLDRRLQWLEARKSDGSHR